MRCLRHTATAALLGLFLIVAPAQAGDLSSAVRIADAVYPAVPQRCGTVKIEYGTLTSPNEESGAIAEAHESLCMVRIRPGIVEGYSDAALCSLLTHEWGHLAGRRFWDNPADPQHSADPADNMYGGPLVHHPACGESDGGRQTREASARLAAREAAERRELRRADIRDELSQLKSELRDAKRTRRRARAATRARYARWIVRLRRQLRRLRAEYRSLGSVVP